MDTEEEHHPFLVTPQFPEHHLSMVWTRLPIFMQSTTLECRLEFLLWLPGHFQAHARFFSCYYIVIESCVKETAMIWFTAFFCRIKNSSSRASYCLGTYLLACSTGGLVGSNVKQVCMHGNFTLRLAHVHVYRIRTRWSTCIAGYLPSTLNRHSATWNPTKLNLKRW